MRNTRLITHQQAIIYTLAGVICMGSLFLISEHIEMTPLVGGLFLMCGVLGIIFGMFVTQYISQDDTIPIPKDIDSKSGVSNHTVHHFYTQTIDATAYPKLSKLGTAHYKLSTQCRRATLSQSPNNWRNRYWHIIGDVLELIHNGNHTPHCFDDIEHIVLANPSYSLALNAIHSSLMHRDTAMLLDSDIAYGDPSVNDALTAHFHALEQLKRELLHFNALHDKTH